MIEPFIDNIDSLLDTNPNNQVPAERGTKAKFKIMRQLPFILPEKDRRVALDCMTLGGTSSFQILFDRYYRSIMEVASGVIPSEYKALRYHCFWLRNEYDWEIITDSANGNKFLVPIYKLNKVEPTSGS